MRERIAFEREMAALLRERETASRSVERPPFDRIADALDASDPHERLEALLARIGTLTPAEARAVAVRLFSASAHDPLRASFWRFSTGTRARVRRALDTQENGSIWKLRDPEARRKALLAEVETLSHAMAVATLIDFQSPDGRGNPRYADYRTLDAPTRNALLRALAERAAATRPTSSSAPPSDPPEPDGSMTAPLAPSPLMRPMGHPVYGPNWVGIAPASTAVIGSVAWKFSLLVESLQGFIVGFLEGLRSKLDVDDIRALFEALVTNFYEIPFTMAAFSAGTAKGLGHDAVGLVLDIVELLDGINYTQVAREIFSVFTIVFSEGGRSVCHALGYGIASEIAGKVEKAMRSGPADLAYEVGRVIGPTLAQVALAAIGYPTVLGAALLKAVALLKRLRRIDTALQRLAKLVRRRGHAGDMDVRGGRGTGAGAGTGDTRGTMRVTAGGNGDADPPAARARPKGGIGRSPRGFLTSGVMESAPMRALQARGPFKVKETPPIKRDLRLGWWRWQREVTGTDSEIRLTWPDGKTVDLDYMAVDPGNKDALIILEAKAGWQAADKSAHVTFSQDKALQLMKQLAAVVESKGKIGGIYIVCNRRPVAEIYGSITAQMHKWLPTLQDVPKSIRQTNIEQLVKKYIHIDWNYDS